MGSGGYVICEYDSVRKQFPEFKKSMDDLKRRAIAKAEEDWGVMKFGGIYPQAKQFGWCPLIPSLFRDLQNNVMVTWDQWFNATGSQTIMTGANTGGTIFEDYKVGFIGLAFLDKAIRVSELKMQISDRKLPRFNVEEVMAYNKPAFVLEEGFVLDEKTGFDLYAYVLSEGPQHIKPIGFQLNKIYDKLLGNTGSLLT